MRDPTVPVVVQERIPDENRAPVPTLSAAVPADHHPVFVYLARLAPGSRKTMRSALDTIAALLTEGVHDAETLAWHRLAYQHTTAVRAALAERYAPASANKALAALRGVLREAWRLGLMSAEQYQRAADLETVRGSTLPRGRALPAGELRALFAACDPTTANGARDAALLAIGYGAGLRRAEIVALDVDDFDQESGRVRVRRGKGAKDRETYLATSGCAAVEAWLTFRGDGPGPLLLPVHRAGEIRRERLSTHAIYMALRRIAQRAGVAAFSPHDLRRSFVSDLIDAGADIGAVQRLAGHANVTTTLRYDRRPEAAKMRAAGLLHIPFGGSL